ncbi:MAG: hypothetical protein IPK73_18695 [Candidatus Obscuribacter sp.]|nr:hypothetical protein [Candidatus Obscuribacter sp.]
MAIKRWLYGLMPLLWLLTCGRSLAESSAIESDINKQLSCAVAEFKAKNLTKAKSILLNCLKTLSDTDEKSWLLVSVLANLEVVYEAEGDLSRAVEVRTKKNELMKELAGAPSITFASDRAKEVNQPRKNDSVPPARNSGVGRVGGFYSHRAAPARREIHSRQDLDSAESKGISSIVKRVIAVSEQDRDLINNPTIGEKDVIDHYETRRGRRPDGSTYTYDEPIWKRVKYSITGEDDIQVLVQIKNLREEIGLDSVTRSRCRSAILAGGLIMELENGWFVLVTEPVKAVDWRLTKVMISEHRYLRAPQVAVRNLTLGVVVNAEVIYQR